MVLDTPPPMALGLHVQGAAGSESGRRTRASSPGAPTGGKACSGRSLIRSGRSLIRSCLPSFSHQTRAPPHHPLLRSACRVGPSQTLTMSSVGLLGMPSWLGSGEVA